MGILLLVAIIVTAILTIMYGVMARRYKFQLQKEGEAKIAAQRHAKMAFDKMREVQEIRELDETMTLRLLKENEVLKSKLASYGAKH